MTRNGLPSLGERREERAIAEMHAVAAKRRASAEERTADALERIAAALERLAGPDTPEDA